MRRPWPNGACRTKIKQKLETIFPVHVHGNTVAFEVAIVANQTQRILCAVVELDVTVNYTKILSAAQQCFEWRIYFAAKEQSMVRSGLSCKLSDIISLILTKFRVSL